MKNIKWGIVSGIVSFILAFLLALMSSDIRFGQALLRALIIMVAGFGIGIGIKFIIDRFIPDLLSINEAENPVKNVFGLNEPAGTKINIVLEENPDAAIPDENAQKNENLGNITDLISGNFNPSADTQTKKEKDIDRTKQTRYTKDIVEEGKTSPIDNKGDFTIDFSSFTSNEDGFSNKKTYLMDSFSLSASDSDIIKPDEILPERKVSGNKSQKLEGDFNPKEIAAGIRTVLEKDKRG